MTLPGAIPVRAGVLVLRPLRESDRDEFLRVREVSAEFLRPWSPRRQDGESPEEHFRSELARASDAHARAAGLRLAITMPGPESERLIGFLNLNNIVRGVFQSADAGWMLSADALGKGHATAALNGLLDVAFAPEPLGLGLHRVQANIIPENTRSLALAERCGFRREGLARAMLRIAGAWRDHVMTAKLAEEHRPVYLGSAGS
ncbi:MAG: GNAT family N-acetyltransferase [Phycisphaerae bacterium]|nr:GNAT family N-acetyltransferase [Phycisphaerae bacterium]